MTIPKQYTGNEITFSVTNEKIKPIEIAFIFSICIYVCQCIFANMLLSPHKKGWAPHSSKLKSPSPKDALCFKSLVEIGPVVLEKKMKM